MIINREKERHATRMTVQQFAEAMRAVDFAAIPPEKRGAAVMDQIATIMSREILDPNVRYEVEAAQKMHRQKHLSGL